MDRKVTYSNFVCDSRPLKKEKYRVCMTVGGDKLDYPHDIALPTAALLDSNLFNNSTISDHKKYGSKFFSIDMKDFLQTIMDIPEYIQIHKQYFSLEFVKEFQLQNLIKADNFVYCEIPKDVQSLSQITQLPQVLFTQLCKKR